MGKDLSNRSMGFAEEARLRLNRALGAAVPRFDSETSATQVFPIKLVNVDTADHVIAIHPASLLTVSEISTILGVTVDAIAKEGTVIASKVSCATKPGMLLEYLQRYVNKNAARIIRLQVSSSSEDQLNESIVFASINPFRKEGQLELNPGAAKRETNQNAKLVTLSPKDVQIDDQTVIYVNLLAGATLQLNLQMGVVANTAAVLKKQAEIFYTETI